jgi:hypothetical protein
MQCICLCCKEAYDSSVKKANGNQFRIAGIEAPTVLKRSRRVCEAHLKKCRHASKTIKGMIIASVEEQALELAAKRNAPPSASPMSALTHGSIITVTKGSTAAVDSASTKMTKSRRLVNTSMLEHVVRPLSEEEVLDMEEKLIEMIIDCHLPFNIVQRPSFLRFVTSLRYMASTRIPGRTKVKEKLLVNAAAEAKEDLLQSINDELAKGHLAGMIVDVWMNVSKIHLEGVILKAGDGFFALQADQADFEHDGMAVARGWEGLILQFKEYDIRFFLSDDAGQCSRA